MPFKKGNQAAKGRVMPEGQLAMRRLTRVRLEEIIHRYMDKTIAELKAIIADPGPTPAIELIIISLISKSITAGDQHRLDSILNRIHGKVPDKVEFEDKTDQNEIERLKAEYKTIMRKP